jgi:hypothetical protein
MKLTSDDLPSDRIAESRWVIVGILLLAGITRFYNLERISVTDVTGIQLLNASAALSLEGSEWPLAGPATEEVRSSAFLVSGIAVASVISWHPFSGIVFVIVLNLCAIALLYHLCAKLFGIQVAAIATLLYASSPWGILYSRLLVSSSCLSVFGVGLVFLSLRWLEERGKTQLAMVVLLGFIMPQIHFSGICGSLWLVGVLLIGRKNISYRSLVTGGVLGVAVWAPWIEFQRVNGWVELHDWVGQIIQTPKAHGYAFLQSVNHLLCMLHSSHGDYWFGPEALDTISLWQRLCAGASAFLLSAILLASTICAARSADRRLHLLVAWIGLPLFCGTVLRTGLSPENLLVAYPVPFVLIAVMVVRLQEWLPARIRFAPSAAVFAIAVLNIIVLARWAQFVEDGRATIGGKYELSYRQRRETVLSILEDSGTGSPQIVGSFFELNPAYESVLMFEPVSEVQASVRPDEYVRYWIEDGPQADEPVTAGWMNRKERQINLRLAEVLRSPPDWVIERHWRVGESQIYRLRFVKKAPLK